MGLTWLSGKSPKLQCHTWGQRQEALEFKASLGT